MPTTTPSRTPPGRTTPNHATFNHATPNRPRTRPAGPLAACGLVAGVAGVGVLATASGAMGQGDPLSEPFPAEMDLADLDGVRGFRIHGINELDYTGFDAAMPGDINGDGIGDLVLTTRRFDGTSPVYVIYGRRTGFDADLYLDALPPQAGTRLITTDTVRQFGYSVAGVGDVNGDGDADFAIGAPDRPGYDAASGGIAYVVFGRGDDFPQDFNLAELDGSDGFRAMGWKDSVGEYGMYSVGSNAGWSVGAAGDINGDGLDDLVIGAPGASPDRYAPLSGNACIIFGRDASTSGFPPVIRLESSADVRIFAESGFDGLGAGVAGGGDIDGDGVDDLLLGAPDARLQSYCGPGSCTGFGSGQAYVIWGRGAGADPLPRRIDLAWGVAPWGFTAWSDRFDARTGSRVAMVGDVDNDGRPDLAIASPGANLVTPGPVFPARDHGEVHIVYGRDVVAGAPPFTSPFDLLNINAGDGFSLRATDPARFGNDVEPAGDVNGDGIDDVICGMPRYGIRNGGAVILFGRDGALPGGSFPDSVNALRLRSREGVRLRGPGGEAGFSVAGGSDINGDGIPDVAIGAPTTDGPGYASRTGAVYVVFGRRPCPADLDGDGALTIFDFLEFQNLFDAGDPRADFDGDGALTVFDFLAFQNAFDAGCP